MKGGLMMKNETYARGGDATIDTLVPLLSYLIFVDLLLGQSQAQAADAIEEAKALAVYDDFSKFVGFLEEVAGYDPAPSTLLSDDIQILKGMSVSFPKLTTMSEIKKLVKWIYKAPMFWNKRKILILFKFLSVMYKENKKLFISWLFYQKWYPNWRTDIYVNSDMKKCYQHNNRQNWNYKVVESFILFIRNFLVHPPGSSTEIDAYRALLLLFPQLLGTLGVICSLLGMMSR